MSATVETLELACGGARARFAPDLGGALLSLSCNGFDVVRPTKPEGLGDPLLSACFPLAPFSNRIRQGRFVVDGAIIALTPNWDGDEHAIHGISWRRRWLVLQHGPSHCIMGHRESDWWPWRYRALQSAELSANGLRLSLSMQNLSDQTMPAGLGFHPYLRRDPGVLVQFSAKYVRANALDRPDLSEVGGALDFRRPQLLGAPLIDHCYDGWDGEMTALYPNDNKLVRIQGSPSARCCVLFAPPAADYFCFEPTSHLTGAFEAMDPKLSGVHWLAPRQWLRLDMNIGVHSL